MKNKTYWIAETAVMIALLVALQWATKPLGQFVTGSCVNLVLGVSTLVGGVWCGAVVAIASPFCAFLVGVGPAKLLIVPFIAVGNVMLVLLLHFIAGGKPLGLRSYLAVAAAAVCKFAALFLLPLLGGSVGALLGMRVFHHKTKHWYFVWGIPLILLAQMALAVWLLVR